MGKVKTRYFCQTCGQETPRWFGKCPGCGEWNTLVEEVVERSGPRMGKGLETVEAIPLPQIEVTFEERINSGIGELNRVLGGGVVPGSFVLLAGEPGIGKSTLTLQMAGAMAQFHPVLYVSGEESNKQIKLRAERLGINSGQLSVLAETRLNLVRDLVLDKRPGLIIIDSIQTMVLDEIQAAAGSVSQVREGAAFLMRLAKEEEIPIVLVGHVTKEGSIAGPRVLEHIVDTVLYFEGDRHHVFRLLRAVKNRFGSTNEIGVFEMRGNGLYEISNPSAIFVGGGLHSTAGSAVAVLMEGTRPLLVEIQALVTTGTYGPPRRTVSGVDYNRVLMLLAVLDKRVGLHMGANDVFVNIAGGVRIEEPAVDLAIAAALVSSFRDVSVRPLAVIGEVGLTGEVRGVSQIESRIREAVKLGFEGCVIPEMNAPQVQELKFPLFPVSTVEQAISVLFG